MPTKTKTAGPESSLRKWLQKHMVGILEMTWHEDREINPGVPDLSYVVKPGNFETGWLELKAVLPSPAVCRARREVSPIGFMLTDSSEKIKFEIEPSQHEWMSNHAARVPCHFLLGYGEWYFLLDAKYHRLLVVSQTIHYLRHLSVMFCHESELRVKLAHELAELTDRYRHVE